MKKRSLGRLARNIALCLAAALAVLIISSIVYAGCFVLRVVGFIAGEAPSGQAAYSEQFPGVTSLYIHCAVGEIVVRQGSSLCVEAAGAGDGLHTSRSGDSLTVELEGQGLFSFFSQPVVIVTVPEGTVLESLTVSAEAGRINLENLQVQRLAAKTDLGSVQAQGVTAQNSAELEAGLGTLRIYESSLTNPELKGGLGLVEYEGVLYGYGSAEVGMGALQLSLRGQQADYNITTDIGIGGSNFTGLPGTASAGAAELLLTNGVGSINVQFQG